MTTEDKIIEEDGGRHRLKPTLEAAEEWLIKSFESYFSEQLSSLEQRKDQELSQYKQQLVEEIHAEIKQGVIDFPCDFAYNDGLTKAKSIITKGDL